jgi:hypothetical protein
LETPKFDAQVLRLGKYLRKNRYTVILPWKKRAAETQHRAELADNGNIERFSKSNMLLLKE